MSSINNKFIGLSHAIIAMWQFKWHEAVNTCKPFLNLFFSNEKEKKKIVETRESNGVLAMAWHQFSERVGHHMQAAVCVLNSPKSPRNTQSKLRINTEY